jgi:uncharacterized Zn finger protein
MSSYSSYNSGYYGFAPYVSVGERRAAAAKLVQKAAKSGKPFSPVNIAGRKITTTFWGNAWCKHLESYSDYENRLPRGRTYARNGSVIDLQITKGRIIAKVYGSELYKVTINIAPLSTERWESIKKRCGSAIDSLVDLLKGKLSDGVMQIITDRDHGLFPSPSEIKKDCSCPDSAGLCKHLAAVLYGIGARFDTQPELLFTLRGVDHTELIDAAAAGAAQIGASGTGAEGDATAFTADQLGDVFGIDIDTAAAAAPISTASKKHAAAARKPAARKPAAITRKPAIPALPKVPNPAKPIRVLRKTKPLLPAAAVSSTLKKKRSSAKKVLSASKQKSPKSNFPPSQKNPEPF